ncbi:putative nuclease HARBI1, partial [Ruditapes philippinarum]|uniref:putative nuclease HARBI1 n=1 Tax=Ruditapes philippinarum TaxID=129788 RepID=UPI00295A7414
VREGRGDGGLEIGFCADPFMASMRLMAELVAEDPASYRNFTRIEPDMFQELLHVVGPTITKNHSWFRRSINPALKLAIALGNLATGDSYRSLMYGFQVAHSTICGIVLDVCQAINSMYAEDVIPTPTEPEQWQAIADQFAAKWQFPHTLGALDGKHVAIRCPKNGGSLYYNYKGYHSIVLLALVDADYKFTWVNIGAQGGCSDAQIWTQSDLKLAIKRGLIGMPDKTPLPGDDKQKGYYIIADNAFAMRTWLIKPFSRRGLEKDERNFNNRLSRARRVVENAFGILANRFRCLFSVMPQRPDTVCSIGLACVFLHNIMRSRYHGDQNIQMDQEDDAYEVIPGAWRDGFNMGQFDVSKGWKY